MKRLRLLTFAIFCAALAPSQLHAADPGDAGVVFLRIGLGARAAGMGDAFTAVAKDASSIYWNPAAMAPVLSTNLIFMHNEYLQSVRLEQAAITHETKHGTLGLAFSGLYMDEMDRYEDTPTAIPLGKFSAYDVSFTVGYARYIVPNLSFGVAGKYILENIDNISASGWALDVGVYHVSRIKGVKLAAVIQNLGSPMQFSSDRFAGEEFNLPRTLKIGGSWERPVKALKGSLLAALDFVVPNDGQSRQHLGLEYGYDRKLFLRGGFKAGYDSQGATFGLGVRVKKFTFDYAVQLVSNDLGDSHRLGFSLKI
jgi:hypothetical protein